VLIRSREKGYGALSEGWEGGVGLRIHSEGSYMNRLNYQNIVSSL
jgi:hypothetical protein